MYKLQYTLTRTCGKTSGSRSNETGRNLQRLHPFRTRVYLTRRCLVDAQVRRRSTLMSSRISESQLPTRRAYVKTLRVTHPGLDASECQSLKHTVQIAVAGYR